MTTGPDAEITTYNCAADTRAETYTAGDEHMGLDGTIDVKLLSSDPAPPARGNNSWVILLSSMSAGVVGAPMDGLASDITVTPYMPDHMHGTQILVEVTPVDGQTGEYTLSPVNLWMPGFGRPRSPSRKAAARPRRPIAWSTSSVCPSEERYSMRFMM